MVSSENSALVSVVNVGKFSPPHFRGAKVVKAYKGHLSHTLHRDGMKQCDDI